ncbi:endonuclease/exonuclease/phosphatase family protein [Streptomyces sp. NBC_01800]|nr:endonuclease/exonuclease/phosphatase family protein [Streptomyces sp. NBC_01800]WSA66199.1 endonuclease/exonuclease/phosphatase family protein [Streptomyces sp. NBC_01800]
MVKRATSRVASESRTTAPRWWPIHVGRWRRRWGKDAKGQSSWSRGRVLAALAVLTSGLMAFHAIVPNTVGHLGSLLEAFLPWLGLAVPVLLVLALLRRSATALVFLLLPAAVWANLFGGLLLAGDRGVRDITALQHNVSDENTAPARTAKALIQAAPELIALEELTPSALPLYETALAPHYPYHAVEGTVGLWSKYPLADVRLVDIKPKGIEKGWSRGLRADARTPWGEIAVYVAHLPSVRVRLSGFDSGWRDESAGLLGAAIAAEKLDKVILLGDFNSTVDDRGLAPVTSQMNPQARTFAFSWPAVFPVSRIDHIMTRSATVTDIRTLPATGSDHLPIAAGIKLAS